MSDIVGDEIVEAIRDLDPATDQVARGIDHYVQEGGDKLDKTFGMDKKPKDLPPAPELTPIQEMPTLNSAEARAAKRRSMAMQAARRGRLSTILTNDDALGG